jgi:ribosomal protein L37E
MSEDQIEFHCRRCGDTFTTKQNLIRHIKGKDKCEATIEQISKEVYLKSLGKQVNENAVACKYCGTLFNHSCNMYTHHKVCKKNPSSEKYKGDNTIEPINPQQEIAILKSQLIEHKQEILKLKQENQDLQKRIEQYNNVGATTNATHNGSGNININQYITQNITLKNFGEETKDHISNQFILSCIMREAVGIRNLIEKLHFDEDAQENKNVRYKSTKRKIVEVVLNNDWVIRDEKEILKSMIRKACNTMREYYNQDEALQEKDDNQYEMKIYNYFNEIFEYKSKYKNSRDMVKALIEQHT